MAEKNLNHRASVLFPVLNREGVTNKINFLSYWKLKNQLENVSVKLTFRDTDGRLQCSDRFEIDTKPRAFDIKLNDYLPPVSSGEKNQFNGSLEIEVFFEKEPFIKYPALVFSMDDGRSCSSVHSCLRCYNPNEIAPPEAVERAQTGFDVFLDGTVENFLVFIGGKQQKTYELKVSLLNSNNETCSERTIELDNGDGNRLFNIKLDDLIDTADLYEQAQCKVKVSHDIKDVFPRFYVGSYGENRVPTLTHTFFDESDLPNSGKKAVDQDPPLSGGFLFPVLDKEKYVTSISSYGSNMQWEGGIRARLLDKTGKEIDDKRFDSSLFDGFLGISKTTVSQLFPDSICDGEQFFCKYELYSNNLPERFKIGLNIGAQKDPISGTNICFSPAIFHNELLQKKISSTWSPIGGSSNFRFFYHNTWLRQETSKTLVEAAFYSQDGRQMDRKFDLEPDESITFSVDEDEGLRNFFGDKLGYVFVRTENPFFSSWYLSVRADNVGGDHSF